MQRPIDPREKRLDLKSKSVLIVDENPNSRQLLIEICRTLNVRDAIVAKSPTDAMSTLQADKIDVVICDWSRPPLDAPKFVMCVRSSEVERVRQVPIVVIKASAKHSDVVQARDGGATEFISPPLSVAAVLRVFESIFLKPRSFVNADGFHGPDRRRRSDSVNAERRHRSQDAETESKS